MGRRPLNARRPFEGRKSRFALAGCDRRHHRLHRLRSPCTPGLKLEDRGDFMEAWGGIASLQLGLSTIWTEAASRGITFEQVHTWMSSRPGKLLGWQRKGALALGCDADLVVFEPEASRPVRAEELHHRHPISPYLGQEQKGRVDLVLLRGEKVYERLGDGEAFYGADGNRLGRASTPDERGLDDRAQKAAESSSRMLGAQRCSRPRRRTCRNGDAFGGLLLPPHATPLTRSLRTTTGECDAPSSLLRPSTQALNNNLLAEELEDGRSPTATISSRLDRSWSKRRQRSFFPTNTPNVASGWMAGSRVVVERGPRLVFFGWASPVRFMASTSTPIIFSAIIRLRFLEAVYCEAAALVDGLPPKEAAWREIVAQVPLEQDRKTSLASATGGPSPMFACAFTPTVASRVCGFTGCPWHGRRKRTHRPSCSRKWGTRRGVQ